MSASETDYLTHDHYFLSRSHDDSARRTLWVVGLTAVMMVGEIIAGLVYGSMALLADGFHMATHAGALAVAAGAYAYAKRHAANRRFSFGTGKVGDLAGFASQAGRPGTRVPSATPKAMAAKIHPVSQRSRKDRRRGGAASVTGVSIIAPPEGQPPR